MRKIDKIGLICFFCSILSQPPGQILSQSTENLSHQLQAEMAIGVQSPTVSAEREPMWLDSATFRCWLLSGTLLSIASIIILWRYFYLRAFRNLRQTEKALRESEARYRAIIEDQTELVCRFLPDGTLTFANNAYCRYFQKDKLELINHTFYPLILEEDREIVSRNIAKICPEQPIITYEHRVIVADEIRWHQWTDRGIFDAQGRLIEYQAVGRDITPLKAAEAEIRQFNVELETRVQLRTLEAEQNIKKLQIKELALKESEARYRRLVEASPAIIYEFSSQRGGIYYSAHAAKILGYPLTHLYRHPWLWHNSIHPEDLPKVSQIIHDFSHGKNFEVEYRIRDAHGQWHWFYDRSIGRRLGEREMIVEGLAIDITDSKNTQIALEKAHQQLTFHVENTPLAVIEWDDRCKVKYWSSQAENIFGWSAKEVIGLHWDEWQFVHEAEREKVRAIISELIGHKQPRNFQRNRNYTKEGRVIDCEWYNSVLYDNVGQVVSILSLVLDISDRKQAEAKLEQHKELLQSIVDNIPVMLAFFDLKQNFIWVNREWEKVLGWTSAQMQQIDILARCYPDPEEYRAVIDYIEAAEGTWQDFKTTVHNGTKIDTSWANVRLSDGSLIGIGQDITQRKQMEAALRESEAKYRLLFDANPNPLWVYDRETLAFLEVNESAITHYGYSRKEFLSMTIQDIRPSEDLPSLYSSLEDIRPDPHKHYHYGFWRHRKRNGEMIDVEILAQDILFEGRAAKLVMAKDITESLRVERALAESEERFRRSITDAPLPIMIHAEDGEVIQINRTWTELSGYCHQQIPTIADWMEKAYSEDQKMSRATIERIYDIESRVEDGEFTIRDATGKERVWNFSSAPLGRLPDGRRQIISMALDVTERKEAEKRLRHDALHDALTELPNRVLLMHQVERCLHRAELEPDHLFSLLFVDLDRFKMVNDSLGHLVGDRLLVAIARTLKDCIRNSDMISRLGGDEFIILLDRLQDSHEAIRVAQRICSRLESPFKVDGHEFFITASIGIAFNSTAHPTAMDILRNADLAMYRAKESGKARYAIFDPEMHIKVSRQLDLETKLRVALDRREFLVHYQPIVCIRNRSLIGFEALVRWQHPDQGLISPSEFIPIAEETGLIVPLGAWVLNESCRQLKAWQDEFTNLNDLQISVNLSSRQLQQADLIQTIDSILVRTGLSGNCLKLEITESLLMQNPETAITTLLQLRERHIQISIDDFGTGYSSLSYLHRLPVDTLKIDRSFVSRMSEDGENLEIVEAIINLAHHLGVNVIAEGVETQEHLYKLQELGCESAQGYLFSPPLNAQQIELFLGDRSILSKQI